MQARYAEWLKDVKKPMQVGAAAQPSRCCCCAGDTLASGNKRVEGLGKEAGGRQVSAPSGVPCSAPIIAPAADSAGSAGRLRSPPLPDSAVDRACGVGCQVGRQQEVRVHGTYQPLISPGHVAQQVQHRLRRLQPSRAEPPLLPPPPPPRTPAAASPASCCLFTKPRLLSLAACCSDYRLELSCASTVCLPPVLLSRAKHRSRHGYSSSSRLGPHRPWPHAAELCFGPAPDHAGRGCRAAGPRRYFHDHVLGAGAC